MKKSAIIVLILLVFSIFTNAQTKLSLEMAKKIEDATPKPLPQLPIAPRLKSDAQDGNLNGKVKRVVEEKEDLSGTWSYQGRHFRSIIDFDEKGNYVKAVYFSSNGNPYEIAVYGYIDGARVSDSQTIYEGSGILTVASPPGEEDTKKPKFDPRYNYKYEYKYVAGRLAEMQMFYSSGEKGMQYVYNFVGNRQEKLVYTDKGKLNQKYITVFDDKGYEIEWHNISVINLPAPDKKYIIKNESLDKQGNWTKRTFSKLEVENGKKMFKPGWVEYRTITYYQ
jgi:hypothetical protein